MKKSTLYVFVGLAVTMVLIWYSVPGTSIEGKYAGILDTIRILRRAHLGWLVPILALRALFFWTRAYRWKLILLKVAELRTYDLIPATMIGFMAKNVLPAHLGEPVRAYVLAKSRSLSMTAILTSIGLERLLDALVVLFFLLLCLLSEKTLGAFRTWGLVLGAVCLGIGVFLLMFVTQTERVGALVKRWTERFPEKLRERIVRLLISASSGLYALRNPRKLAWIMAVSVVHWLILAGCVQLSLWAFSLELPLSAPLIVLVALVIGVAVPATPGAWGVVQACFVLALAPYGVARDTALAASLYYHLSQYIPVTCVGLTYMSRMGYQLAELRPKDR